MKNSCDVLSLEFMCVSNDRYRFYVGFIKIVRTSREMIEVEQSFCRLLEARELLRKAEALAPSCDGCGALSAYDSGRLPLADCHLGKSIVGRVHVHNNAKACRVPI